VDVNVGDPITPAPAVVSVPRLLHGHIRLIGYPLPMVHAEKLVTAMDRGVANTRWRDFADVYLLARRHDVNGSELTAAVGEVAAYRGVPIVPLHAALKGYAALAQSRWEAWRRRNKLDDRLPRDFDALLGQVAAFADPVATGTADGRTWIAADGRWSRQPTPPSGGY
jgi:hypothetical protein